MPFRDHPSMVCRSTTASLPVLARRRRRRRRLCTRPLATNMSATSFLVIIGLILMWSETARSFSFFGGGRTERTRFASSSATTSQHRPTQNNNNIATTTKAPPVEGKNASWGRSSRDRNRMSSGGSTTRTKDRLVDSPIHIIKSKNVHDTATTKIYNDMLPDNYTNAADKDNDDYEEEEEEELGLSALEVEFRDMMLQFTRYSERDIASVEAPRYRALYQGVAAGALEPDVYRAFGVLYQDIYSLRIAGRMIFRHLQHIMEQSIEARHQEEESILAASAPTSNNSNTVLTLADIETGRKIFSLFTFVIHPTSSHDPIEPVKEWTLSQLVDSGIIAMTAELLGYANDDDVHPFIHILDPEDRGRLDFESFMTGLQRCVQAFTTKECNVSCILDQMLHRMEEIGSNNNNNNNNNQTKHSSFWRGEGRSTSSRQQKYSDQYDHMLTTFGEWENRMPTTNNLQQNDSRRWLVLRGCFTGAKNPKVANALKIVYTDYSALRVAGDLIFKLMTKVMNKKQ